MADFTLTLSDDNFSGTAGDDAFIVGSNAARLAATDILSGGNGTDTLRFQGTSVSLGYAVLAGLSSVEVLDFTAATSSLSVALNTDAITQATGASLKLMFGNNAMTLNVSDVEADFSAVVLDGTGQVTLRNFEGQAVSYADGVNGTLVGGTGADRVSGGNGDDNLSGGAGDDVLHGNNGDDTLTGGDGNDYLAGDASGSNSDDDTLTGGAGFDVLVSGRGSDTLSGGTGSDTFIIKNSGGTVTITDFDAADGTELIDLRDFASISDFGDLTIAANGGSALITAAGLSITLTNVSSSSLSERNFLFAGMSTETVAEALTGRLSGVSFQARLTLGNDSVAGTSGDDVIEVPSNSENLTSTDLINGAGGTDTLRFFNTSVSLSADRLDGVTSIETLDVSQSTTALSIALNAHAVDQADNDALTIAFGRNAMTLDTSAVGSVGTVKLAGIGEVTLRNFEGQRVTVVDGYYGKVTGGTTADIVTGGNFSDVFTGGLGDDQLFGNGGADTLSGGDGNDLVDGGAGDDTLSGGAGFDLIRTGTGTDQVSGGTGSDTFRIGVGSTVTISDFDTTDLTELLDLRDFSAIANFADLTVTDTVGGARVTATNLSITLQSVTASSLSAKNFLFNGNTQQTVAEALIIQPLNRLTLATDNISGTANADVFEVPSNIENLTSSDTVNGGAGTDTLRFAGTAVSLAPERLTGLTSIERLDVSQATSSLSVALDAASVGQADGDTLTILFGRNALTLDVSSVGTDKTVQLAGVGEVTLRNFDGQKITIQDGYDGDIVGGSGSDTITGGSGNDTITGGNSSLTEYDGRDVLSGGAGNDTISGGLEADQLDGGAGNDIILGGAGNDRIISGLGDDTLTGGTGLDTFRITSGANATITDFEVDYHLERIDLRDISAATAFSALSITDVAGNARITVGGTTITLNGVQSSELSAGNFIFFGAADPTSVFVEAGTDQSILQRLIDEADAGTTINLGAGEFSISETLYIKRSDITLSGAGRDQTILKSVITSPQETLYVKSDAVRTKIADVSVTGTKGANTITLSDTSSLSVGQILYIAQSNDEAFFTETGNTGVNLPSDYNTVPQNYTLREALLEITAINGNQVTLSHALPYTFAAGVAEAFTSDFLKNVVVENFKVETNFAAADPLQFENRDEAWNSVAAIRIDSATDSTIRNVATYNVASHAFYFQRVFGITADNLYAKDSQNKGEAGNGYAFYLAEAFGNTLTNLVDEDMRHSVLFSTWSAEHYNDIHVTSTNRDINFHGSPDADNTIVVDSLIAEYGDTGEWKAVGPGTFPIHPYSTIEDNDVRFRYLRSSDLDEVLYAHQNGADMASAGGNDTLHGDAGADTLDGQDGNDTLYGNGGADVIKGSAGLDVLRGGGGADTLQGGSGADIMDGEAEGDTLDGGAGDDLITVGAGDTATGGDDSDTFVVTGSGRIADFDLEDAYEKIDLRAISAATGFETLVITQVGDDATVSVGGVLVTLSDTTASMLAASHFVFAGSIIKTLAELHTTRPTGLLSSITDTLTGTAGDDIFDTTTNQLTSADTVNGLGGTDTLRFVSATVGTTADTLAGLTSIERLDVSQATGLIDVRLGVASVDQADGDRLVIFGGVKDMQVTLTDVAGFGTVVAETFGQVTMRNFNNQELTISDLVNGNIIGGSGTDTIIGGALADTIKGNAGVDTISGGGGNDTIEGGTGNDIMDGGAGSDRFIRRFGDGSDTINNFQAGVGGDVIALHGYGFSGFSNLVLTQSGSNTLVDLGQDGSLLLNGIQASSLTAANFDFVADGTARNISAGSASLVVGGDGDDTISVGTSRISQNLTIIGGAGRNTVKVSSTNFSGNTSAFGTYSNIDVIDFSGNTTLSLVFTQAIIEQASDKSLELKIGNSTTTTLNVGSPLNGAKLIIDGGGQVNLTNGTSHTLYGGDAVGVRFTGGDGADTLTGGALADILNGGGGNDRLDGAGGADTMTGGAGNDTYVINHAGDTVSEAANGGTDSIESSISLSLGAEVENLLLTGSAAINGTGNALANTITGNSADNTLSGLAGADTLDGGAGNDTMLGGAGSDIYIVDSANDIVDESEAGSDGTDTVRSSVSVDLANALRFKGNVENAVLLGAASINALGNALDNELTGNSGANTLRGEGGNDTLDGGAGNDTMIGGSGDDTYVVDAAGDVVTEVADGGSDTVRSSVSYTIGSEVENLVLLGAAALNGIGNGLGNRITGNGGNNILNGLGGADTMIGGAGDDRYYVDVAGDVITELADGGTDEVRADISYTLGNNIENLILTGSTNINGTGNGGNNLITGNSGNNVLLGGTGDDTLSGGAGDDTLGGGSGMDRLIGGAGNDTYIYGFGDTIIEAVDGGIDTVQSSSNFTLGGPLENIVLIGANAVNATGNAGANEMTGNGANNILKGLGGNDTLRGEGGNDTLDGGTGNDTMIGGSGNDTYVVDATGDVVTEVAGGGSDTVRSSVSYTLGSEVENLVLLGAAALNGIGNGLGNRIAGNGGNNILNGLGGADTMIGGAGDDRYYVDVAGDVVTELSNEGTDEVRADISYTLGNNIENLILTGSTNINGTGNGGNNLITGNAGNNVLLGGSGDDTLSGGAGDDTLGGGSGMDRLIGGAGNDTYIYGFGDTIIEAVDGGIDTVQSSSNFTLGGPLENIVLIGANAVNATGNAAANEMTGNGANNILQGLGGNDTLKGEGGNDTLNGGVGNDTLIGGAGLDRFLFSAALDAATNVDTITDFSVADDTIALSRSIFAQAGAAGVLDDEAFYIGAAATETDDRIIYDSLTGALSYDADGSGAGEAVRFASLSSSLALTYQDFLIV